MSPNGALRYITRCVMPMLVCTALSSLQEARSPIPVAEAIEGCTKRVRQVYKDAYARNSTQDLGEVAANMREAASQATDLAEKYVLLNEAVELASKACNGALALVAIDDLDAQFRLDCPGAMRIRVLRKVQRGVVTPEQQAQMAELWLVVTDRSIALEDFESAQWATRYGRSAARASADQQLLYRLDACAADLPDLMAWRKSAIAAEARLRLNRDDSSANLEVGRYLCLGREDWARGLPHLIAGNNLRLKALAEQDLATPAEPLARKKLADDWWQLSEEQRGRTRTAARRRAAAWYRSALPALSGLDAQQIEQRLADPLLDARAGAHPVPVPEPDSEPTSVLLVNEDFHLRSGRREIKYRIEVPRLPRREGTLRIIVINMGDNSGDGRMSCELRGSRGEIIFHEEGHRTGDYRHPVKSGSRWTVELQDLDTTGDGNGGRVEVYFEFD